MTFQWQVQDLFEKGFSMTGRLKFVEKAYCNSAVVSPRTPDEGVRFGIGPGPWLKQMDSRGPNHCQPPEQESLKVKSG